MLQSNTINGNVENTQLRFVSPQHGPFFGTSLLFLFRPIFWEPLGWIN